MTLCSPNEKQGKENLGQKYFQMTRKSNLASQRIMVSSDSFKDLISFFQWRSTISWLPARIQLLKPEIAFTTDVDGFR